MIKIDFEVERDGYVLKDALHLPDNHTFTDADIEAMKQQRFENWYTFVTTPVEETESVESNSNDVEPLLE